MASSVKQQAEEAKARGNDLLKQGSFEQAAEEYTRAIELDGSNHIYYSNRAAAYCKSKDFANALADANRCVDMAPNWAKGYHRLYTAYEGMSEMDKAQAALKKFRDLGGAVPTAARAAAGGGSTGGAAASSAPVDLASKAQLGLRVFLLVNTALYLIPFTSSYGAYQRALFAAFGAYMIHLYRIHGKPEPTQQYAQRIATDVRAHYAMTALLFAFAGTARLIVLIPHVLSEVGYVADYVLRQQPQIAAKLSPTLEAQVLPRMCNVPPQEWASFDLRTKWQRYNTATLTLAASVEVAIGVSLIVELFTPQRSILILFAYWHFLRIRYMVSPEIKTAFAAVDARILGLVSRVPMLMNGYQRVRTFAQGLVQPPNPSAPPAAGGAGGLAGMASRCVIS